jgi:hypothetical protein
MDGSLEEIKVDPTLMSIPVFIWTTSSADDDVVRSHRLHANAFITKAMGLDAFSKW